MRKELTLEILSPRLSDFLRNPTIGFGIFLYFKLYQEFQFNPIELSNENEIVRACDRHSNETVTLRKHVTKYKNKQKLMVEFLRKSESRGDKISGVNSSHHQIYQFPKILYGINWAVVMLTFLN